MNSVFFEVAKDYFVRSESIRRFYKETIKFPQDSGVQIIEHFYFVIEGMVTPLLTSEKYYNSYLELLKRNSMLKRSEKE